MYNIKKETNLGHVTLSLFTYEEKRLACELGPIERGQITTKKKV